MVQVVLARQESMSFLVSIPQTEITFSIQVRSEQAQTGFPNPLELFLSALGSCVGVSAEKYLTGRKISFTKLSVKAQAELSQDVPTRLSGIKVVVSTDAQLGDGKENFLRYLHNCPVHSTIIAKEEIDIQSNP